MTYDNIILIKGCAYNDVKKALQQWIDLYPEVLQKDLVFELYSSGRENHIIKADRELTNTHFYSLFNYLKYPEGIEYKIELTGFTTGKYTNGLENQKLQIFIPENDTSFVNVFVVTEKNQHFKINFGGRIIKVNESKAFGPPKSLHLEDPEIITLNRIEHTSKKQEKTLNKIKKRFSIILYIILTFIAGSLLTSIFIAPVTFFNITFFIGFGIGFWFFFDYLMLRINNYYNYCLFISIFFLLYIITADSK